MPQDSPDAVSPLAPFHGSYTASDPAITRRWFDARDITPELRTQVLDVLQVAFNGQPNWFSLPVAPEDHFDWKFRDRPTGATAVLSLDSDDRIIGFVGSVRRIWLLQGRPYVTRAGYDLCRLPEWQGRGVQRALQPFRSREWHPSEDFALGYVTHPADLHSSVRQGNKAPKNETHDYVHLLHPLEKARGLFRRSQPTKQQPASTPLSNTTPVLRDRDRGRFTRLRQIVSHSRLFATSLLARRPAPRPGSWTISSLQRFEDHHQPFITQALSQFDFVADRSIAYLNWRYCDHRAGPFTVRLAEQDGQTLGYAVTRILDGDAYLADILVLPNQSAVAEALVRDSIAIANEAGADSVRTRLPKLHPYQRAIRRAGFFDIGHVAGELIDPRGIDESDLAFLDDEHTRIHHVLADSDYL